MRKICRICVLLSFGLFQINGFATAESAQESNAAPVFLSDEIQPIKTTSCTIETEFGFVLAAQSPTMAHCDGVVITLAGTNNSHTPSENATQVEIELALAAEKKIRAALQAMDFPAGFVDSVEFADLNGDGKADFIMHLSNHGNGLAAEIGGVLFLLSQGNSYDYVGMKDVMQNSPFLLRYKNPPAAVLLLKRLAVANNGSHSLLGLDKQRHTFFVFDLLQFDTSSPNGLKLNNSLDARFPLWTRFTEQTSYQETSLLVQQQKQALWRNPLKEVVYGKLNRRSNIGAVQEKDGNIFYADGNGITRQLTFSKQDAAPVLSPDGQHIAFVRNKPKKAQSDVAPDNELWLTDIEGKNVHRLIDAKLNDEAEKNLSQFNSLAFSTDSSQLYFLCVAWVTSNALHVLNLQTGEERFVVDANSVRVINRGKYANHLVVQQHKYFTGHQGGSYDYYWLIAPSGKEIKRVGKTESQMMRFVVSQEINARKSLPHTQ